MAEKRGVSAANKKEKRRQGLTTRPNPGIVYLSNADWITAGQGRVMPTKKIRNMARHSVEYRVKSANRRNEQARRLLAKGIKSACAGNYSTLKYFRLISSVALLLELMYEDVGRNYWKYGEDVILEGVFQFLDRLPISAITNAEVVVLNLIRLLYPAATNVKYFYHDRSMIREGFERMRAAEVAHTLG